jgi:serine/threonine protein kinase
VLEIEFMMRCKDHPNIVEIYDVYADKDAVYIVMEQV